MKLAAKAASAFCSSLGAFGSACAKKGASANTAASATTQARFAWRHCMTEKATPERPDLRASAPHSLFTIVAKKAEVHTMLFPVSKSDVFARNLRRAKVERNALELPDGRQRSSMTRTLL